MFNLIKNRIWLFTVLFCLLVVVYGYIAGLFIWDHVWADKVYNSKFVSIQVRDIGIITLIVTFFVFIGALINYFKIKNPGVTIYKAIVSIGLFAIAFWYFFDAFKRVFVTLPDVQMNYPELLVGDAFTLIYTMMIFEVISSLIMMYCSFRMILSITAKSKGKDVLKIVNLKTLSRLGHITQIISITVATLSLAIFVIFVALGKYTMLETPYKGFGPMFNVIFFIAFAVALQYITRFYRSIKRQGQQKRIKTHRVVIILLFAMCGILGTAIHETMVTFNDNFINSKIFYETSDVWIRIALISMLTSIIGIGAIIVSHVASIIMYALEFSE